MGHWIKWYVSYSGGSIFPFIYFNAQADIYDVSNALTQSDYATAAAEFTKLAEKGDTIEP
ncbi:MAG: hypothetical protein O7D86_10235 [Proteobacteria bacterium]|nr:hypothetical protein [Pseudomonadota bacterium]